MKKHLMRIRPSKTAALFAILLSFLFASGCRKHHKRIAQVPVTPKPAPAPLAVPLGHTEEGLASWYGIPYHGRHAADGEIYDMETLVAAHRVLPFNTWLLVTNLANEKTVKVRIIDRGPFVSGRIIDLSKAAARQIDLLGPGVARVRLQVIGAPVNVPSNDFYGVQVGAFSVRENAEHARLLYAQRYVDARIVLKQGSVDMWRVIVGREASIESAQELAKTLSVENKTVFVVRLDNTGPASVPSSGAAHPPSTQ
jgi:peptidoglycan lytic transglycosylase